MRLKKKLLTLMVIFSVLAVTSSALENYLEKDEYTRVDVIKIINNTIVFGNNCTAMSATTSPERAQSIQLGLDDKIEKRPTSQDTMFQILKTFNITLDNVTIESKDEDFYYSNMYLRDDDTILKLDTMPSDAIALALRTNSTIYINKTLLKKEGFDICGKSD